MKVNNSNVKLAFRKLSNNAIRVVMLQLKPQNSDVVTLQTPSNEAYSYSNSTGYEFVHRSDLLITEMTTKCITTIYDIEVAFNIPGISNIAILSSGNVTYGTLNTVKIGTPSVTPSILFCLFKSTDATIDELFTSNTINTYLCCRYKRSTEQDVESRYFQVSSNDIQKIDDYTALIVGYMYDYAEVSLPTFIAYEVNDATAAYKNIEILDSGIIVQNSQTT